LLGFFGWQCCPGRSGDPKKRCWHAPIFEPRRTTDARPPLPTPCAQQRPNNNSTEKNGAPHEVFQALCPYCGGVNAARSWADGAPADLMVPGVFVERSKSWLDGNPVWAFDYARAGRAYGFDFKGLFFVFCN
jgi:hypothetical protein